MWIARKVQEAVFPRYREAEEQISAILSACLRHPVDVRYEEREVPFKRERTRIHFRVVGGVEFAISLDGLELGRAPSACILAIASAPLPGGLRIVEGFAHECPQFEYAFRPGRTPSSTHSIAATIYYSEIVPQGVQIMNDELPVPADPSDENIDVELSLGQIEISLSQFLALRPGMIVEFDKPAIFEASLTVAGRQWGTAQVTLRDDKVELKVSDIQD